MQHYDIALKTLLLRSASLFLGQVSGASSARWSDVELVNMENRRVDLLGETESGELIQLEFQSTNDRQMLRRMAEYSWAIQRQFGRMPRQTVVYIGRRQMRMKTEFHGPDQWFRYKLVDIRDLDGDELIRSGDTSDSIVAVLARLSDRRAAVRKILNRISALDPVAREEGLRILTLLSGLREMEQVVREEAAYMPIIVDVMQNKILGPEIRKALKQGRKEGVREGREQGQLTLLTRMIEARFGPLPHWAKRRLSEMPAAEFERLGLSMINASSLKELLK